MKKYKITARFEDGRKESMVIDTLDSINALIMYAYTIWDTDGCCVWVAEVEK